MGLSAFSVSGSGGVGVVPAVEEGSGDVTGSADGEGGSDCGRFAGAGVGINLELDTGLPMERKKISSIVSQTSWALTVEVSTFALPAKVRELCICSATEVEYGAMAKSWEKMEPLFFIRPLLSTSLTSSNEPFVALRW